MRIVGGLAVPADWNIPPFAVSESIASVERGREKLFRDPQNAADMGFSNLWFKGTEESSTYYIKTKNGTLGVLQINRLKDYPRSVEFRYKLLGPPSSKRQRFVPVEGKAGDTHWAVMPPPSIYSKTDWAVQASMTLGGQATIQLPSDKQPRCTIKLLKGNDDAITLEVQDAAGKLKTTVSIAPDQPAEVTVDGVGYKFYYPTVNVALKDADTSPFADVIVIRVELPRQNAANDERSRPDSPVRILFRSATLNLVGRPINWNARYRNRGTLFWAWCSSSTSNIRCRLKFRNSIFISPPPIKLPMRWRN